MRVGIHIVYMDYRRGGKKRRGPLQSGVGALIGGLLPQDIDIHIVNETWEDPDWDRHYDLVFISCMHSDFDRARQVSHYWRRRGAKTVFGGIMASTYPQLCQPFFDAVVIGDAEGAVPQIYRDFSAGQLKQRYVSEPYQGALVPMPRVDLMAGKHLVPLALEATRGCPFSCDFCALTGIGTRYHTRPIDHIVRDVRRGQRMLAGKVPWVQQKFMEFMDNNLGGNPKYLVELCKAMEPLDMRWGAALTFNALSQPGIVQQMVRAGCRTAFVGLESFNEAAISDMRKFQNVIGQTEALIDRCRRHGLMLEAGLMLSPLVDDRAYVRRIPRKLAEVGLYIPTFISFECPIPGTPYFERLAADPEPAFLPNALLRDFTGYTLVARPKHETAQQFVAEYKWVSRQAYTPAMKLRKLGRNAPAYVRGGDWVTLAADVAAHVGAGEGPESHRTYLAGTDTPPPEATSVPLSAGDFETEEERRAVVEPWRVTDAAGRVLPMWTKPIKVFDRRGRLSEEARGLVQVQ